MVVHPCDIHKVSRLLTGKKGQLKKETPSVTMMTNLDLAQSLFRKFQLIPILRFQVMHDYMCFIAPRDYCVKIIKSHVQDFL